MLVFSLNRVPLPADQVLHKLEERGIRINHYAEKYISHRVSLPDSRER